MRPAGSNAQPCTEIGFKADGGAAVVQSQITSSSISGSSSEFSLSAVAGPASAPVEISYSHLHKQALEHHRGGRIDQALELYRQLLLARPGNVGTWCNLGAALRQKKHYQSAVNCYRHALTLDPDDLSVLGNLANALTDLYRFDESLALHLRIIEQEPQGLQPLLNLACTLREAGSFDEALAQLQLAQAIEPGNAKVEWERAQNLLYLGRYREGWQAYEARWRTGDLQLPNLGRLQWRGEDIAGKTIFLYSEQGYGDTILAARFIRQVKERVGNDGRVILQCKPELHRLFAVIGADQLIVPGDRLPTFDVHCPLMSTMGCLGVQLDNVPAPAQLHIPDESRRKFAALGRHADAAGCRKVGIVWSGSTTFKNNENRALGLDAFLPFAEIPDIRLYSLQKGPCLDELRAQGAAAYIEDVGSHCSDFADTAAAIEKLDAIVMTDSSVAHLAASLGKPVINLLQKTPYWLYTSHPDSTPWYPGMRLLRQERHGEWGEVLRTARERLEDSASIGRISG